MPFLAEAPGRCPNCEGEELAFYVDVVNTSGVVDGRLRLHDVSPVIYLGCEICSETIRIYSVEEMAEKIRLCQ